MCSPLCVTRGEGGGRVSPLSPGVTFFNHLSIIVGIPYNLPPLPSRHFDLKKRCNKEGKKNTREVVTVTDNNSAALGQDSHQK